MSAWVTSPFPGSARSPTSTRTWTALAPPRARRRAMSRARTRRRRMSRSKRWPRRSAATRRSSLAANATDVAAAKAAGHDAAFVDRLALTPAAIEAMAAGVLEDRRTARSHRRDQRAQVPAVRHPGRAHARAARRRRHRLRVAAQRHGRRRGALPQGRQRDDPARRLRGPRAAIRRSRRASTRACARRACPKPPCR